MGEIDWRKVELVIYTKEIEERKKTIKYIPTSSVLLTFDLLQRLTLSWKAFKYGVVHLHDLHYEKKRQTKEKACSSP